MSFRSGFFALIFVVLCVSFSLANGRVIVVPIGSDYVIVPLTQEPVVEEPEFPAVILFDELTNNESLGEVDGGRFTERGWEHESGEDKIVYDLGQSMEAGIVEFELTGMSAETQGGYILAPGYERAYYFGLFSDPTGDKRVGGTNPAFIEIRYNWGDIYVPLSTVKFQVGDAGLAGNHKEFFGVKAWRDWNPDQYYKHKIEFGDGVASLYIDDVLQVETTYTNREIGWQYLFIGDINYHGMSGPDEVTYRNIKVTKIK